MRGARATVVIVDDDPQIAALCRLHLEGQGRFEVCATATTAAEGLQLAATHQPAAALIDLGLPDRSGESLLSELLVRAPATMLAAFTATAAERAEVRVRAGGAFTYYEKDLLDAGRLGERLAADLGRFRRAVLGEEVVAPSAVDRRLPG